MTLSAEEMRNKSREKPTEKMTAPTTEKPTAPVKILETLARCIYILINSASAVYMHILTLCLLSALRIEQIFQKDSARSNQKVGRP